MCEPGFLLPRSLIILEQQVSLASARAAFDRLLARVSPLTRLQFPVGRRNASDDLGLAAKRLSYSRQLAQAILHGLLDIDAVATLPDYVARAALVAWKHIGPWTADIYLLMCLRRPDIWPVGDSVGQLPCKRLKRLRPASYCY